MHANPPGSIALRVMLQQPGLSAVGHLAARERHKALLRPWVRTFAGRFEGEADGYYVIVFDNRERALQAAQALYLLLQDYNAQQVDQDQRLTFIGLLDSEVLNFDAPASSGSELLDDGASLPELDESDRREFRRNVFDLAHAAPVHPPSPTMQRLLKANEEEQDLELQERATPITRSKNVAPRYVVGNPRMRSTEPKPSSALPIVLLLVLIASLVAIYYWRQLATPPAIPIATPTVIPESNLRIKDFLPQKTDPTSQVKGQGDILIVVEPRQAVVLLNGAQVGTQTPLTLKHVEYANHNLEVRRPGYQTHYELFNLDTPQRRLHIKLKPLAKE